SCLVSCSKISPSSWLVAAVARCGRGPVGLVVYSSVTAACRGPIRDRFRPDAMCWRPIETNLHCLYQTVHNRVACAASCCPMAGSCSYLGYAKTPGNHGGVA